MSIHDKEILAHLDVEAHKVNLQDARAMRDIAGLLREGARALEVLEYQRAEAEYWRKKFNDEIQKSMTHSKAMLGGLLDLALQKAGKSEKTT